MLHNETGKPIDLSNPAYPVWQTAIRQAQAEMTSRQAAEQAQREAQEAERQQILGVDLSRALDRLGIPVERPEKNEVILDDFIFSLGDEGYRLGGGHKTATFVLLITLPKPAHLDIFEWSNVYTKIFVHHQHVDGDWSVYQAELAAKLDELRQTANRVLGRSDLEAAKDAMLPDSEPTPEQKLADLIRAIVREELDGRNE